MISDYMKIPSHEIHMKKIKERYKRYFERNLEQRLRIKAAESLAMNPNKKKIEEGERNPLTLAKFKDQEKLIANALEKGGIVCPVCNKEVAMRMLKGQKTWINTISGTMHLRCHKKAKKYYDNSDNDE